MNVNNENNPCDKKTPMAEQNFDDQTRIDTSYTNVKFNHNDSLEVNEECQTAKKGKHRKLISVIVVILLVIGLFICVNKLLENIHILKVSHEAYKIGCQYYENKDYKNAIESFEKVNIRDENYEDAQRIMERCKEIYFYKDTVIPNFIHIAKKQSYFITGGGSYIYENSSQDEVIEYVKFLEKELGASYTCENVPFFHSIMYYVNFNDGTMMCIQYHQSINEVQIIYPAN